LKNAGRRPLFVSFALFVVTIDVAGFKRLVDSRLADGG
jgi:hypothetical protein